MLDNNKGFTIIELLVVISIILVLVVAVLVSFNSAKERAKEPPCKRYEDRTIQYVPVKCYEYFKINVLQGDK